MSVHRKTLAVLVTLTLASGLAGCSTSGEAMVVETVPAEIESTVGYKYFGSAAIAQGSTFETSIDLVESTDDIDLISTPDGVAATIFEGDEGRVFITLEFDKDAPIGGQAITFDIAGEPEPVEWNIEVLPR